VTVEPQRAKPYRYPQRPRPAGELPPVHEALLADETPYEMYDGRLTRVASANPPHAIRHTEVAFVLRANTAPGYISALDLKTRVDQTSEVAPDASIYPAEADPDTAGRRLEELVVEVTGRQSFAVVTRKAKKLAARGVRRIFCVRVKRREVVEWVHADATWSPPLAHDAVIADRCLVRPLVVLALLDAAAADDEAARGLLARKTPALVAALDEADRKGDARGMERGLAQGLAQGVLAVLDARGVPVSEAARRAILACADAATQRRWIMEAATAASGDALVGR
jgi:hypothetical protein